MIIVEFSPYKVVLAGKNGKRITLTSEPPHEFDYDIIEKIWEDYECDEESCDKQA